MCPVRSYAYFLLIVFSFLCSRVEAQQGQGLTPKYYVEHFGEEEGLPQNSVNNIFPDANGFLWIATEGGIARFNGNRFLPVSTRPGISTNNFTRIKNFYAIGKDSIIAYASANNMVALIVNNTITAIERKSYSRHGLLFLNGHAPIPAPAYINETTQRYLGEWNIQTGGYNGAMYNKDTFLVTLNDGIAIYNAKDLVAKIRIDNFDPARLMYVNKYAVYVDEKNNASLYSTSGFIKKELLNIPAKRSLQLYNNSFESNFYCVTDSELYRVSVNQRGELDTKEILTGLQNGDDIRSIYEKDSNTIVAGTVRNGLYVYKRQFFSVTEPLPKGENDVFYLQQLLPDDRTILAGLNKLFRGTQYIGKTRSLFATQNYSSLKDNNGNYWYVYYDKILRSREPGIDVDTIFRFRGQPGMFFQDKQQRIWFSSSEQFGYFLNDRFTEVNIKGLPSSAIACMQQDNEGRYFIAANGGLSILTEKGGWQLKEVPELRSLDVRFVLPEVNGEAWICTYGNGLFHMADETITAFPQSNGKISYVHYIFEDGKGNFWMPTNNGLFVTSRESLLAYVKNKNELPFYYRFSKKDGLRTNEFNGGSQPAYLKLPGGEVSLASMKGLVRFNPARINFNFSSSPILVDNIGLDSTDLVQRDNFEIKSNVNNISFSVSGAFWGEEENDLLEYQVVENGKPAENRPWLQVGSSGKINLFSPSHGDYELIIRKRTGLKKDDYLYKTISFRVLPKWYQTKLFYLLAVISLALVFTGISFWRRRYYRRANRLLKEKVDAATIELQQMNNTLEKKVEERTHDIQQAEIKFRTLVEGSLAGVYIVQGNEFIYVNPRFEEILGYEKGELAGTDPLLIIREDQRDIVAEKARLRWSGEVNTVHYEITGVQKNGSERQLEFFGSKTNYEGKPTIIGTMVDITERKKMEIELREAELKFRDLVEKSMVGVYIIQDGKFSYVNPRLAEMFGYNQEELINSIDTTQLVEPESVAFVNKSIKAKLEGEIESNNYEARGLRKDGQKIWMEIYSSATLFQGKNAVIGSVLDITDRKLAKEQLIKEKDLSQSIINSLPGVFYVFDQNGRYQLWNKNHETVTGYTAEEMSKLHPDKFIEESKLEDLHKRMEKVFTEGYAELEANFLKKDGTGVPYYFNGILINYNDKPCIMGVGIDISEQKKAEDQLIIEKDLSQSIINSLPGVFFIFDQDRTHLLWNRNFEIVTGYSSEELKQKKAGMCVEEPDIIRFTKAVEKMYATGTAELEVTLINKAKKKIPFYVNGIAITYEGKPCILGIGIDISQRKKAENEREHANYLLNERIKELTTLYRAGLVLQREERSIIVTLHDFVSMLPGGWQYPDVTAACITLGEMQFITPGFVPGPYSQSSTFTTSDGTTGKIEVVYLEEKPEEDEGPFFAEERKLIDMLADMLRIYFTRREAIEALQKSEANLHTIFDNTDTVYALLDQNFQVIAYNQRAADFSKKELKKGFRVHDNILDYFPGNRQEEVAGNFKKAMQGNSISYEISYPQADGKLNWYYVRMFPIKNAESVVFGAMLAVSDITEKKLLEQAVLDQKLQEQKTMIRAILIGEERERNKIGQELHDNVNQILAGTKLYLGMARKAKEGGEDIINESMALIDSAIEEIRTLSKGKVTPMKKVNLEELLYLLIEGVGTNTDIKTNFVYQGSAQSIADDLKLNIYRIIQEQLNNILKHANAKNISVRVEAGTNSIRVLVADDGKGFDPGMKKKGIGISNMINRVESFNGTMSIESSPGNGCTVDINIPF